MSTGRLECEEKRIMTKNKAQTQEMEQRLEYWLSTFGQNITRIDHVLDSLEDLREELNTDNVDLSKIGLEVIAEVDGDPFDAIHFWIDMEWSIIDYRQVQEGVAAIYLSPTHYMELEPSK